MKEYYSGKKTYLCRTFYVIPFYKTKQLTFSTFVFCLKSYIQNMTKPKKKPIWRPVIIIVLEGDRYN